MTEKKMHPVLKVAVLLGAIGVTGTVGYYSYQAFKKWKDNKNGNTNTTETSGGGSLFGKNEGITDSPVETPPTINSFDKLKQLIGSGNYTDYQTYIVVKIPFQSLFGVSATSLGYPATTNVFIKYTNGARWALFRDKIAVANRINEGSYQDGGKKVIVMSGRNVGVTKSGTSPISVIQGTLK